MTLDFSRSLAFQHSFGEFSVRYGFDTPTGHPPPPHQASDAFQGTTGDDVEIGTHHADNFAMEDGGNDTAKGRGGDDVFNFGGSLTRDDHVYGGDGSDELTLEGDYSAGVTFGARTMQDVERLTLAGGYSYTLKFAADNGIGDGVLTVSAAGLGLGESANINAHALNANENVALIGGAGADVLIGGHTGDVLTGGLGQDNLTGNGDVDEFRYISVSDSTSVTHDIIHGFNAAEDFFSLPVGVHVNAVDRTVFGDVNPGTFDQDIAAGHDGFGNPEPLRPHHAVLFIANDGVLAGHIYLLVDVNGQVSYQAGEDFVFEVTGITHSSKLHSDDFQNLG